MKTFKKPGSLNTERYLKSGLKDKETMIAGAISVNFSIYIIISTCYIL